MYGFFRRTKKSIQHLSSYTDAVANVSNYISPNEEIKKRHADTVDVELGLNKMLVQVTLQDLNYQMMIE